MLHNTAHRVACAGEVKASGGSSMTSRLRIPCGPPRGLAILALVVGGSATALAQSPSGEPATTVGAAPTSEAEVSSSSDSPASLPLPPLPIADTPAPMTGTWDWVRLVSGEWLRGEIRELRDQTFLFHSEKLGDLTLDWADVAELYSPNANRFVRYHRGRPVEGHVHVVGDVVDLQTVDGEVRIPRSELTAILPGELRERSRWALHVGLGFNGSWGASRQTALSGEVSTTRQDAHTRLRLGYTAAYGSANGDTSVNNQWGTGTFDVFLTDLFYVVPVLGRVGYNRFQNFDLRAQIGAGIGIHALKRPKVTWDIDAAGAYLRTKFASVMAPADRTLNDGTLTLATRLHWDVTGDIAFEVANVSMLVPSAWGTSQFDSSARFSSDIWGNLHFDLTFKHTRIRQPQTRADGTTPDKDQFQLIVGLGLDL